MPLGALGTVVVRHEQLPLAAAPCGRLGPAYHGEDFQRGGTRRRPPGRRRLPRSVRSNRVDPAARGLGRWGRQSLEPWVRTPAAPGTAPPVRRSEAAGRSPCRAHKLACTREHAARPALCYRGARGRPGSAVQPTGATCGAAALLCFPVRVWGQAPAPPARAAGLGLQLCRDDAYCRADSAPAFSSETRPHASP